MKYRVTPSPSPTPSSGSSALDNLTAATNGQGNSVNGGTVAPNDNPVAGQVFWGSNYTMNPGGPSNYEPVYIAAQDAANNWYDWSDNERAAFTKRLYDMKLVSDPHDYNSAKTIWFQAVAEAANFHGVNGKNVTPWDAVSMMGDPNARNKSDSPYANADITRTEKSTQEIDADTAHSIVRDIYQKGIGRDPTGNELARYTGLITGYAKAHPTNTTTNEKYNGKGILVSTTSNQSGGMTSQGMGDALQQNMKTDPEYGAYQAATTYYNAMMDLVNGSVG